MTTSLTDRGASVLRFLFFTALAISLLFYVCSSLKWPLLMDSPVMHYVTFLTNHGLTPYRDITDNNMPGSYLTERWAMDLFGTSDLAWRIYDFSLLMILSGAAAVIAEPYDRLAGLYAGGMFALLHASEGPNYAGEREQVVTMLLVVAVAALFTSLRRRLPLLCLFFGASVGMACSIKPTLLLFPALVLPLTALFLMRQRISAWSYLLWSLAGLLLALLADLLFLLRYHAFGSFLFVLFKITPAYVSMHRPGFHGLIYMLVPRNLLLLLPFALAIAVLFRRVNWEHLILLIGAAVGAISFFVQQKGFLHHRYTFVTFFLLLLGLAFFPALRHRGWLRLLGALGILLTLCSSIPHYLQTLRQVAKQSELTEALESDLTHLGVDHLQRNIMCFDLVYGCLNSLYHLGVVENNGFTGDLLLFSPTDGLGVSYYRNKFAASEARHPSAVYVVTNQWFGDANTFSKIDTWPAFRANLEQNYTLVADRSFPHEGLPAGTSYGEKQPPAYRIYLRKGSGLRLP